MAYQRGMGLTPGYTAAQQAMADAYLAQTGGGGGGAIYVAPVSTSRPACADSPYASINSSQACIDALQAWQQQNMQAGNAANYNVDLANCLATFPQPPDCYQRTFGLTPTGGYTSDAGAGPKGSTLYLNAAGQPVTVTPAMVSGPLVNAPPAPHPPVPGVCTQPDYYNPAGVCVDPFTLQPVSGVPNRTPAAGGGSSTDSGGGTTGGGSSTTTTNYVTQGTDFLTGDVSIGGFNLPMWGLLAAGAAALLFLGGKH